MIGPTDRQLLLLQLIHQHCADNFGQPPTMRWLCSKMGINSTNGLNDHLVALERKGLVTRQPEVSRGLWLTDAGLRAVGVLQDGLDDFIVKYSGDVNHDERVLGWLKELLRRRNGGNV